MSGGDFQRQLLYSKDHACKISMLFLSSSLIFLLCVTPPSSWFHLLFFFNVLLSYSASSVSLPLQLVVTVTQHGSLISDINLTHCLELIDVSGDVMIASCCCWWLGFMNTHVDAAVVQTSPKFCWVGLSFFLFSDALSQSETSITIGYLSIVFSLTSIIGSQY